MDTSEQSGAIAEGRRIYLGNILYSTRPNEIEHLLEDHGFGNYQQIHVSVDPVSGRNPGYCFVDFNDRATAEAALTSLVATLRGRPLKVGPCQPKQPGQRRENRDNSWGPSSRAGDGNNRGINPSGDDRRWGNWKKGTDGRDSAQGIHGNAPRANLDHFNNVFGNNRQEPDGKRVYIGGLGKMVNQEQNQVEMAELLRGFQPLAIGKRITARDRATQEVKPFSNYCFVDFETVAEAQKAIDMLNNTPYDDDGHLLRVSIAHGTPDRLDRTPNQDSARTPNNHHKWQASDNSAPRALDSMSWRRKD